VNLGMTQGDLAEFFGVARPSIARTLGELEDAGYIIARGKHIEILNRKALSDLTNDI
jgi:CRP-like cAMP-binding protein